ncbi:MAG TPA: TonB C-terminal domain-containing protein [Longimicrobiales bacterium]|nr:TonB C-terminal domain-containing protein [Longimicrobiales bacterium]
MPRSGADRSVMGSGIGRRTSRPDRRAVVGSVVFHLALGAALFVSGIRFRTELPEFVAYRVQLRSPPPTEAAAEPEPVEATTQIETPEPPPEPAPRPPEPKPEPRTQTAVPEPEKPKPAEPQPARGPDPEPAPVGGENIDVMIEGQEFPYPGYLDNIIVQNRRHFRWSGRCDLEASVAYYIDRDGNVGGIRLTQNSTDWNFNLQVKAAVELAGRQGAYGALPDGWIGDRLWVKFTFLPGC